MSETLMIAGGGTGGHIYPAIAVARAYVEKDLSRKVVFVGTARGLETTIVPKAGFPLELISVGGLNRAKPLDLVRNLFRLPVGFFGAWGVIGKHRPSVVLGVGGYSSGPVLVAAALRGVPTMIHEQNAFPGITNRILARLVKGVAVGYTEAARRLKRKDAVVTGNPVRKEFFELGGRTRAPVSRQRLLIFGGSQGSHVLNEAMTGSLLFLGRLKDRIDIVHQTGLSELEGVRSAYRTSTFPEARVVPYLDPMAPEIAAADLVVCRAGAMTIGELAAVGRASILVPFAAAANNHQELNARVVEKSGGSVVITEGSLTHERLAAAITDIISNPQKSARMGAAARALAAPAATEKIVDLLENLQRSE